MPEDTPSTQSSNGERRPRAIVTGAAGFVGSHLCDRLLEEGFDVIGVDNFLTGRIANVEHLEGNPHFELLAQGVEFPLDVDGPVDWILHFASPASPPKYQEHPIVCMRCNGEGTFRLLELARRKGASFFLASTSEIYGDPEVHPQVEDYRGNVSSTGPRSMYDEAKRYAEAMTMAYRAKYGVATRIIRLFNTNGPRMDPEDGRVISNFVCQALRGEPLTIYGDGGQTRSFQYVDDLIDGIRAVMDGDVEEPINLGNPQEVTIRELAEVVRELMDRPVELTTKPLPKDDPTRRCPDITRAKTNLDWAPSIMLRDGLEKTIPYFQREIARRLQRRRRGEEAAADEVRLSAGE